MDHRSKKKKKSRENSCWDRSADPTYDDRFGENSWNNLFHCQDVLKKFKY